MQSAEDHQKEVGQQSVLCSCHNESSSTWYRVFLPHSKQQLFYYKATVLLHNQEQVFLWGMHCICVCYTDENHTSFDWTVNQISENFSGQ